MKVLLVNPPQDYPFMPGPPKKILSEGGIYPHLGLLHIGTCELKRCRNEIKILDTIAEKIPHSEIQNRIAQEKPDVVGVTLTTLYLGDGYRILQAIKGISKDIITVVGGPHVCMYPKQTIAFPEVDVAVYGEAELVFSQILEAIELKQPLENILGVVTKNNADKTVDRVTFDNLDDIPILERRLLPINNYYSILAKDKPITIIMTSRGCPFRCAYCPQAGTKLRKRNVKKVVDEIQECLKLGIKDILFFDELFTLDTERVKELCDEILNRKLKFRWNIRTRIKDVSQGTIDLLKKAGCRLIQFGIESGTERIQKLMNKNLDLKKVEEVIKMTRKAGILTYGNFMLGSPGETIQEMQQTIAFAKKIKLDFAVFAITILLPGTDYYKMAQDEHKVKEDFWEKYVNNPLVPIENAYWPDFDKSFLENICKNAYLEFYFRPWYFWNYFNRIMSLKQLFVHLRAAITVFMDFISKKPDGQNKA